MVSKTHSKPLFSVDAKTIGRYKTKDKELERGLGNLINLVLIPPPASAVQMN